MKTVPIALFLLVLAAPAATVPPAQEAPSLQEAAALLLHGDAREAARVYAELVGRRPDDEAAMVGRVHALLELDRWREALAEARRYAAGHPGGKRIRAALGEALFRAGRLPQARKTTAPMIADPDAPARALLTYARVEAAAGRTEGVPAIVERAVAKASGDRFLLLQAAGYVRERASAMELLERYLALSEGDDPDRIEAARGNLRFFRAVGDRPFWVPEKTPEKVELSLRALAGSGGRTAGYVLEAAAAGDGKKIRLLLDTGSTGLFLVERIARRRGGDPLTVLTIFGGGGDRRHLSRRAVLPHLFFGDLRFSDALVTTTRRELEPRGRYHGIVGLWAFQGYQVTLDLRRQRLLLEPPPKEARGEPYWEVANQLLVEAGIPSGPEGLFVLDTGTRRSALSASLAEELPPGTVRGGAEIRGYGGRMEGARVARGVRLRLQGFETAGEPLNVLDLRLQSRLGGVEVSGFVGRDLLEGKVLVVDTVHHRFRLEEARK